MITFSASVPPILDIAQMFEDVEITFGSERVLSRELAVLEQATTAGYRSPRDLATVRFTPSLQLCPRHARPDQPGRAIART